jgi:hypothetical protein
MPKPNYQFEKRKKELEKKKKKEEKLKKKLGRNTEETQAEQPAIDDARDTASDNGI